MVNLPIRGTAEKIVGTIVGDDKALIEIINSNGFVIERVRYNPDYLEGLAEKIASLITEARNQGFDQGVASIRRALQIG